MNCNNEIDVSGIKIELFRNQIRTYQAKLSEQIEENKRMQVELEKLESKAQQFVISKAKSLEEIAEGKSMFNLISKEVEVKKKYLEKVMKEDSDKKRKEEKNEEDSIEKMIRKIVDVSVNVNKTIGTKTELNFLKPLKEININETNMIINRLCL